MTAKSILVLFFYSVVCLRVVSDEPALLLSLLLALGEGWLD